MVWGAFANLIPMLPDFAGAGMNEGIRSLTGGDATSKARKNYIHDVRTLRRREYQDMVWSLQKAGLNPVLAVGAQPGHASAQMVNRAPYSGGGSGGVGTALAANKQADTAAGKAPSEIGLNLASTGLKQETALNTVFDRANILQQYDINSATIDKIRQDTATLKALQAKHTQDAITGGYSAKKIKEETEQIDQFGLPGQTWEGVLRQGLTDGKVPATAKDLWNWLTGGTTPAPRE